jgi:hypothetical protein
MSIKISRPSTLDDEARQILMGLADILIPASERMPSASQAGVGGEWIDRAMEARQDWAADLVSLLERARGKDYRAILAELQTSEPATFTMLTEMVAGAYFMNPEVRKLIGYPGQRAIPIGTAPDEQLEELLKPVVQRGPIYRSCPS